MIAFACIFAPDFPVQALLCAESELRSEAVAVLEGKAPLEKVFAANEKARCTGVEIGMTKLQVEACPELVLRTRSPLQENSAHAALLDCAQLFSPWIEDAGCDTIILDLAGMESLFGSLPKIAHDIARRASDFGFEANVAVATNPDTAVIAARGFPGVTVIAQGKEAEQLGSLPLEALFADESDADRVQILDTLSRWGIRNLRTLAALPEIALSERLGQEGVRLQQLARGATSRTLVPVEPLLVFEEVVELEHPLVLLEPLAFLLARMLEQLCARLSARALATQEIRLQLELDNGSHTKTFHRTLRLPVPLLDEKIFLKLLQLDLSAHPPGAPIATIHLSAEPVRPRAAQSGLFLPPSPEPEKLELTLARIAGIVGENKVGAAQMMDTHHPQAFQMQRFMPGDSQLQNSMDRAGIPSPSARLQNNRDGAVTALRIFRPPVFAAVSMRDGVPARITCPKRKQIDGEILWGAGPWRSSGDWWEREGWSRDEWDIAVQQESGIALYRLVRDLLSGRWFVEGTYD
jgi:protein ImuB